MGPDHHGRVAGGNHLQLILPDFALEFARQPGNGNPEGSKPGAEVSVVLLCENFRRRHQRYLPASFQCLQGCHCRYHRLASTDIALHQTQHRLALLQVSADFDTDAVLGACQRKRQALQKLRCEFFTGRHGGRLMRAELSAQAQHGQLMGQQLLKGEPMLGPVTALFQGLQIHRRRRAMQGANRLMQGAQLVLACDLFGQQVNQAMALRQPGQRSVRQATQALLRKAFGARVNGRQRLGDRQRLIAVQVLELGMVYLQP